MAISFETENFKDLKQKEKTDLFFLIFFVIMSMVAYNLLGDIADTKTKVVYAQKSVEAYEKAIYSEDLGNKVPVNELLDKVKGLKDMSDKKLLLNSNLDNWKYIEFFINFHLAKINQNPIAIGDNSLSFVNWADQTMTLRVVTTNGEHINYLLTEFSKSGYLTGFEMDRNGNLYESKIKLNFKIN